MDDQSEWSVKSSEWMSGMAHKTHSMAHSMANSMAHSVADKTHNMAQSMAHTVARETSEKLSERFSQYKPSTTPNKTEQKQKRATNDTTNVTMNVTTNDTTNTAALPKSQNRSQNRSKNRCSNKEATTTTQNDKPTNQQRSSLSSFFNFPSALLGDDSKAAAVAAAASKHLVGSENQTLFNFPSALFDCRDDNYNHTNYRDESSTSTSTSSPSLNKEDNFPKKTEKTAAEAKRRLEELEATIEAKMEAKIEGQKFHQPYAVQEEKFRGGTVILSESMTESMIESMTESVTESMITQMCLDLDAIDIPKTDLVLRAKRKELLQRAQALDAIKNATTQPTNNVSSTESETPESETPESQTTESETSIQCGVEISCDNEVEWKSTPQEEQFRKIEKEMKHLEDRLCDPHNSEKVNQIMVEELVTQFCCKLDAVDLTSTAKPNILGPLKARRKELLRRAEKIEEILSR